MRSKLQSNLDKVIFSLYGQQKAVVLSRPDQQFGDYSTNVAMQLAAVLNQNPVEIANSIIEKLKAAMVGEISEISVVGSFINIRLSDAALIEAADRASEYRSEIYQNKVVVAEYSDPNPFKILHVGHLYTSVLGDSMANLIELGGGQVHRVNFGGDVGLHVAKSLWSIIHYSSATPPGNLDLALTMVKALEAKPLNDRADWLSQQYIRGTADYEDDREGARAAVAELNKQVYAIHEKNDHESTLAQIYWLARQWSYDYFVAFYREIDIHPFEKFYPESQTAPVGLKIVRQQLEKGVFEVSDGAVVFDGEKYGLHTRVFISSAGLPTYEAKDVGLIFLKWEDFHFDKSIIITDNNQAEYQKVVQKSIEQFRPELAKASSHITHGRVKLRGGRKMSSRQGNIVRAAEVLKATAIANQELIGKPNKLTTLGAVKYAFLKHRPGADIIYDPSESVSLVGNSGPYLQYAYARGQSILGKLGPKVQTELATDLTADERSLARKIGEYPEVLERSIDELMPHHICTYLYSLAQTFNSFYENNRVSGDSRESLRARLVKSYVNTLKAGLEVLHIASPDHL